MLYINQSVLNSFIIYSKDTSNEVCGLLVSTNNDDTINEFIPIPNTSSNPQHFFTFSPEVFVQKFFEINKKNGRILGVIHSHPTNGAYPSIADLTNWYYNDLSYWIYSATDKVFNAFFIRNNKVDVASYKIL